MSATRNHKRRPAHLTFLRSSMQVKATCLALIRRDPTEILVPEGERKKTMSLFKNSSRRSQATMLTEKIGGQWARSIMLKGAQQRFQHRRQLHHPMQPDNKRLQRFDRDCISLEHLKNGREKFEDFVVWQRDDPRTQIDDPTNVLHFGTTLKLLPADRIPEHKLKRSNALNGMALAD